MISQKALRYTAYAGIVILILTLTGVFDTFQDRVVITDSLRLNTVVLILMLLGTSSVAAGAVRKQPGISVAQEDGSPRIQVDWQNVLRTVINGIISAVLIALALSALVLLTIAIDMGFVFQNLGNLNQSPLTFGDYIAFNANGFHTLLITDAMQQVITVSLGASIDGLLLLWSFGVIIGLIAGLLMSLPRRGRDIVLQSVGLTVIMGLVVGQVTEIIALPDALVLVGLFAVGYVIGRPKFTALPENVQTRAIIGGLIGVSTGLILWFLGNQGGALEEGGFLYGIGSAPRILLMTVTGSAWIFAVIVGFIGGLGTMAPRASRFIHDGALYFVGFLLILGVLDWQQSPAGTMSLLSAIIVFGIFAAMFTFIGPLSQRAQGTFETIQPRERRMVQTLFLIATVGVLLVAPQFMGLYISNVFNLIALYAMMGIGLNVMIGYTGLLDLGYVASFAIGAYTLGILTTPNLLTCGGTHPDEILQSRVAINTTLQSLQPTLQSAGAMTATPAFGEFYGNIEQTQLLDANCTGDVTFWIAWPFCVFFSAFTGMLLGIPVLRLRGDYLAIVTLGFGEIINRIILSNQFRPLLGGAQGISPIDSPTLNLSFINEGWVFQLDSTTSIYYLFLFGVAVSAFVVFRIINSRIGRAMRAVRADEDVAQAMGINLIRTKLFAFGVSSAFAGLGGAVFAASLQGIFPNSFTLLVSINVLSLIIIGGMGSIPGVMVGAVILIGLPELLRELEAYRLLGFGALLVIVMLTKPEGLLPPKPPQLAEKAENMDLGVGEGKTNV